MRVLLVSTYELGHQPLHAASPAGELLRRGHDVRGLDLAVDSWEPTAVDDVDAVALSVPMHTAMRLALRVAEAVRGRRPDLPICLYGLYAPVSRDHTVGSLVDRVIAGEYEPALCEWIDEVGAAIGAGGGASVHLDRGRFGLPARHLLPPLDRYARLAVDGEERLVGAVEASHGCASRCRHCPVPTVYDGRIRLVGPDAVLADVAQLVDAGAQHLTFADPDFLNGVHHSMRVARAVHERFPHVTFDVTTKVELILRHRDLWSELAALGCLFVTTAMECVDDRVLAILDKGHTAAEAAEAVAVLRGAGIEPRPSLLPFTPWTTLSGLVDLVDFVVAHDLAPNVEPVHWTIRLLLPDGSLLLDRPELSPYLGGYDAEHLGYRWTADDPRVDELQGRLSVLVEDAVARGESAVATFTRVASAIREAAGLDPAIPPVASADHRPRLTEAWFCCAEPTCGQLTSLP